MPTDIYFAGENVRVKVDEDPSQVAEAFASADGRPFRVTRHDRHGDVYVNPAMVAFWSATEPGPAPQPPPPYQEAKPKPAREALTDVWGRPLRAPPRR